MHNNDWGKHSNRYCVPHRVMFGVDESVCDTPRVFEAFTKACLKKGRDFYNPLVPELVEVSDVRLTELSKVVENVKRYVDVAFAQEIYRYCIRHGLDFNSLRSAVNSKVNVELLGTDRGIGGSASLRIWGFCGQFLFEKVLLQNGQQIQCRRYNRTFYPFAILSKIVST